MSITVNPSLISSGQGLFLPGSSSGLVQGTAYPDPADVWALRTGTLAATETLPMWGGLPIFEYVPGVSGGPDARLGPTVGRATGLTGAAPYAGFSVFDQAYGMVVTPQSTAPQASAGMQVESYRAGSGARLAVACDPGLVSLRGGPIGAQVAWDYVNGLLIPYTGAIAVSSGTYNSTTGLVTLTLASSAGLSPGDTVITSAATGTGSFAAINGTFTAGAGTTGVTVTYTIATGLTLTITGGSLTTGAAFPATVLDVQPTNCQTVLYTPSNGSVNWNFNGAAALIQI